MKVSVDPQRCMGHGQCYTHAPEIYQFDAEGYCVVVKPEVEGDALTQAVKGAQACPESAITVSEE
ncbi:ferredoxin [Mycolicibacterium sp. XJ2546]